MRAYLAATGLAVACVLTGCTGGDPEPSPSATPTASRWQRGEIRADPGLCAALTPALLSGSGLRLRSSGGGVCDTEALDDDAAVRRTLTVRRAWYEPPPARPDHTATEEARHEFARPPGWGDGRGAPLRGYGDEAKIRRTIGTFQWAHTVSVAVRVRNLIFQVDLGATTEETDAAGKVPPIARLERDALTVSGALLTRLHTPAHPDLAAAYRTGEVRAVHDVCRDVPGGADLVPGAKRSGTSQTSPGGQSGSCAWSHGDDSLSVVVEAVRPGAADATTTATDATRTWGRTGDIKQVPGLGDQARTRTYDSDSLRDVELWARRGNLLVTVDYDRRHGAPPAGAMRADAVRIARTVLGAYS